MDRLPITVDELIDQLDALYPERCIQINTEVKYAYHYSGQRSVVTRLLQLRETDLEETLTEDSYVLS